MNIALEQTREYVDGKLRRNYGDAFVRGNNGEYLLLFRGIFLDHRYGLIFPDLED